MKVEEASDAIWTQSPPCKASEELKQTMNVLGKHSERFFDKKINHYDNQIRKNQQSIYQKLNLKVNSDSHSPAERLKAKSNG